MKLIFATCAVFAVTADALSFDEYCKDHGKQYHGEEYASRKATFEANVATINAHDKTLGFELGINNLTDWTAAELKRLRGFHKGAHRSRVGLRATFSAPANTTLPDSVDWVAAGATTPVKNQGE